MRNSLIYLFLFSVSISNAQSEEDTAYFERFKEKIVVFTDFGYASAPFQLAYPFQDDLSKLKYRNNFNPSLGIGVSYQWFTLRLAFALKGTSRAESRYGKTNYFNIGTSFQIKNWFFDLEAKSFKGYSIKNAFEWNDTLNKLKPNDIRSNTQMNSFSINAWLFEKENFNMSSVFGRTGHYKKSLGTVYVKPTLSLHGVNNETNSIVPDELTKETVDKTSAESLASLDIGLVPGYAYVHRYNNWQVCGFAGLGGVIQAKFYNKGGDSRGFLGLSPRYDFKVYGGYSIPKFFAFLSLEFDNKSIRFTDLKYRQTYFTWKITTGIRLDRNKEESQD